ncbi:hypothetical protein F4824DRAFT_444700, partial [Ustulina deusta]
MLNTPISSLLLLCIKSSESRPFLPLTSRTPHTLKLAKYFRLRPPSFFPYCGFSYYCSSVVVTSSPISLGC